MIRKAPRTRPHIATTAVAMSRYRGGQTAPAHRTQT